MIDAPERPGPTGIAFSQDQCRNPEFSRTREWLLTNGIGGYASGTVSGMNTRRYHGLLVAATAPPLGRVVMLSQLEDALVVNGVRYPLSTNRYLGDVIDPQGYRNLLSFRLDPDPTFIYGHGEWELTRRVSMAQGENTTVVEYSIKGLSAEDEACLEIRPLIAFRDYHATTHENPQLNGSVEEHGGSVSLGPYPGLPPLFLHYSGATLTKDGYWYRSFRYEKEEERGLDCEEDLFSPLLLRTCLRAGEPFVLAASTEERAPRAGSVANMLPSGPSDLAETLSRAVAQFVVTRPPFKTTIAGYHWFGDWGRDTMISLEGLLLETHQPALAKEILLQYARYIDDGMLPNRFPDSGEPPEYNTVDAALWFVHAAGRYLDYSLDPQWRAEAVGLFRKSLYEPLKAIVRGYEAGTRYGIRADQNCFLWAGDSTTQLTWMDARVGGVPVTPRHGRPVEVQALWYNALRTLAAIARTVDDLSSATSCERMAARLKSRFLPVFWNPARNCLYDVVGDGGADGSLRPNQLFTVSLPYPLLSGNRARQVIAAAEAELLTPYGLRTLAPSDRNYKGIYQGDVAARDSAYHQGTVWPWLAGPFFRAKLAVSERPEPVLDDIDRWLRSFAPHLEDAGLGQISEIFDGDPPHEARGCIAQAWSVAEILSLARLSAKHPRRDHA